MIKKYRMNIHPFFPSVKLILNHISSFFDFHNTNYIDHLKYRYQGGNPRCPHNQARFDDCNSFSGNWVPGSVSNLSILEK